MSPPPTAPAISPGDVASIVSRNVVPLAGVLLFGWSVPNLLALYFVDTIFSLATLLLLVMAHLTGFSDKATEATATPVDWAKGVAGALLGALLIGVPLGVPMIIVLAEYRWSLSAALADTAFASGLGMQVLMSAWQFVQAHRELSATSDDERLLKHRTGFVLGRWLVLVIAAMTGVPSMLGPRIGGFLLLLVYAGASIHFELFPERALRWLNPKGNQEAAPAGEAIADKRRRRR